MAVHHTDANWNQVKYAAKDHLLSLVGTALIFSLSSVLEGFWTEEVEFGWCKAFDYICSTFARAIRMGSNLVTNALIKSRVDDLKQVIIQAPRGDRAMWILQITAIGSTLSPLYWALFDAKNEVLR